MQRKACTETPESMHSMTVQYALIHRYLQLTLNEASEYFGIGYKKLKMFVQEHSDEDFVLWNGNRALIKREQFEKYMDSQMNVI